MSPVLALIFGAFNMTSILTNMSSMAALQTLRDVNSGLDTTQQQVSSGLRVKSASDNVAYWSISTTMRSDNKANLAANDALGVGSAKVDVASAGLDTVIGIVSEFRAKLVTASETSVDQAKVQKELDELKKQLTATAQSSSFSGVNWLNTSVEDNLAYYASVPEDVVSGFIRSSDGSVRVATTQVDTANTSVFNIGGGGALQRDIRSLGDIGGFRNSVGTYQDRSGYENWLFTGTVTLDADDSIAFNISVDGGTSTPVTITKATIDAALGTSTGVINSANSYSRVLNQALADAGLSTVAYAQSSSNTFGIWTREATGSIESSIQTSGRTITLTPPPTPPALPSTAGGFLDAPALSVAGAYATQTISFTGPFRIYRDVEFSFDVTLPDKTIEKLTMSRDRVDTILGTSDGMVNTAADLAALLNAATNPDGNTLGSAGIIAADNGGSLELTIDSAQYPDKGVRSWFAVSNIKDNVDGPDFNILDVDITGSSHSLDDYLNGVDMMLQKVIKGGASLGAAKVRLEMQDTFSRNLMDQVDSGVSRLIDANMEEASARLTALQTQQQLAIQSLQIANSSANTIMQLYSNG